MEILIQLVKKGLHGVELGCRGDQLCLSIMMVKGKENRRCPLSMPIKAVGGIWAMVADCDYGLNPWNAICMVLRDPESLRCVLILERFRGRWCVWSGSWKMPGWREIGSTANPTIRQGATCPAVSECSGADRTSCRRTQDLRRTRQIPIQKVDPATLPNHFLDREHLI